MKVRTLEKRDITACADILCSVYNNEMWQCRWSQETAVEYLTDFYNMQKFIGYILEDEEAILGGIFAREKVWWNNSEIFVEEMFIKPEVQGMGYGSKLLGQVEAYAKEKGLAGITLSTNKYAQAPQFYRKNGFTDNECIMFMWKEV